LFSDFYNINSYGFWEHNNYQLIRKISDKEFAKKHKISISEVKNTVAKWKSILLKRRAKRKYPRLDDKILTSWNGIMLKGYVDAYRVFNDSLFLEIALKNARFIELKMIKEDGTLFRNFKNGQATINGYLEDYGTVIDALVSLYEVTLDEKWLMLSKNLTDVCFDNFYNSATSMFYFTSEKDVKLIARKMEIEDNVIPSSNSMMAKNLFKLSHYFDNEYYLKTSTQMLNNMIKDMQNYGSAYSNWLDLYSNFTENYYEIAVSGKLALEKIKELNKQYLPNKLICGSNLKSDLPLLENRFVDGKTLIYVCVNKTCNLPTENTNEAINQTKKVQL